MPEVGCSISSYVARLPCELTGRQTEKKKMEGPTGGAGGRGEFGRDWLKESYEKSTNYCEFEKLLIQNPLQRFDGLSIQRRKVRNNPRPLPLPA